METFDLVAHPAHPPAGVRKVTARMLSHDAQWCVLRWKVEGAAGVIVPAFAGAGRADGLWRTTCFELFVATGSTTTTAPAPATTKTPAITTTTTPVRPEPVEGHAPTPAQKSPGANPAHLLRQAQDERGGGKEAYSEFNFAPSVEGPAPTPARKPLGANPAHLLRQAQDERGGGKEAYSEFNFAPSERWAAYDFTAYRAGMTDRAMDRAPVITPRRGGDVLFCDVAIPSAQLPPLPWRYALTAVIEETGGIKSFWAPAHTGDRPDFHDPACLAGVLAAPVGA